jgi:hypothetical protein
MTVTTNSNLSFSVLLENSAKIMTASIGDLSEQANRALKMYYG